jgi:oligosaccharide repeat unit polymerase
VTLWLIIILIFLTILYFSLYLLKQAKKDIFRPVVFSGFLFLWFYVFDILYAIFDYKKNLTTFPLSGKNFLYDENGLILTSFLILVSFAAWLIGDMVVGKYFDKNIKSLEINNHNFTFRFERTIGFITLLVLLATLFFLFKFISTVGGLIWYLEHIADRALIYKDATFFYSFIQMAMILGSVVCGFLLISIKKERKFSFLILVICISILSIVILLGLLSGARANVLKSLVIIVLIWNYFSKKVRLNFKLITALILLCLVFVLYADQMRNNFEIEEGTIIDHIFNSVEVSQANNLLIIDQLNLEGIAKGKTIISGFLSFIPSSLFEIFGANKEYGGNALFTEKVWPDRWYRTKSEVALGLLGELMLNFGFVISPFLIFLIGGIYKFTYGVLVIKRFLGIWGMILYIGVIWSLFQLIRGDLFNTINNFVVFVVSCIISFLLIKIMFKNKECSSNK